MEDRNKLNEDIIDSLTIDEIKNDMKGFLDEDIEKYVGQENTISRDK